MKNAATAVTTLPPPMITTIIGTVASIDPPAWKYVQLKWRLAIIGNHIMNFCLYSIAEVLEEEKKLTLSMSKLFEIL